MNESVDWWIGSRLVGDGNVHSMVSISFVKSVYEEGGNRNMYRTSKNRDDLKS